MSSLSRHIREHEAERQARSERARRLVGERLPALLPEYLNTLFGALIGFWLLAELLSWLLDLDPLHTIPAIGLLYSVQATYYTFRLAADPAFTVPRCACAGRSHDDTETVLRSPASAILKVPNALLGGVWYAALIALVATGNGAAALPLAVVAVFASAALGVVMVIGVRALCPICINTAAMNVLILAYLVLSSAEESPPPARTRIADLGKEHLMSQQGPGSSLSGWAVGGITFAVTMMIMIGIFQVIAGLVAIIDDDFYVVTQNYTFDIDTSAWGWIHLLLGILLLLAGYGLYTGATWGAAVAIVMAILTAVENFFFIPYYPFWSILVIALCVWVIWALTRPGATGS